MTLLSFDMRLLVERPIQRGERWVYSAGFNVGSDLTDSQRIDAELPDLRRLSRAGARVALLTHQGSAADRTARHLPHVARYLSERLGQRIQYFPENCSERAHHWSLRLQSGEIALFGNTRLDEREERGDLHLASQFAALGDRVAIGGFSKAHRAHASNVGILEFLPGYASDSLCKAAKDLEPWAGFRSDGMSVAMIGGVKPEKVAVGFEYLTRTYDLVIPGGILLNTILRVMGYKIGDSELGPAPISCWKAVLRVLSRDNRARIYLPRFVRAASPNGSSRTIEVADGIPDRYAIVDLHLEDPAISAITRATRVLLAGTPGRSDFGNGLAAATLLNARAAYPKTTMLLGGDTCADLSWSGVMSAGGGSALEYIATGTCVIMESLRLNECIFEDNGAM